VKQTVYSPKIWVPRAASRYLHARDSSALPGPGAGGRGVELHKETPHWKESFERRKEQGWMTEITRWNKARD